MAVLHSRFAAVMSHPLVPWVLFVSSPFLLYFTGWYEATLDNRFLHEMLHVHFLVVGSLFFWPLLGVDPVPGRSGHPFRMLLVAATLPFHAFLGVSIMSVEPDGRGLLAADHYLPLHGLAESVFQQQLGGGLLWASGDLVGLLFLGVLPDAVDAGQPARGRCARTAASTGSRPPSGPPAGGRGRPHPDDHLLTGAPWGC
jgi:putative copper resistance protein D